MKYTAILLVGLLGACVTEPQVDGDRKPLTNAETHGVLDLVNAASLVVLDDDVRLDSRAANNIVDHRQVDVIDSIAELDAISYVGPSALNKLLTYALANGYVDTAPVGGVCLIISEYIEAWGNYNKAVELFNCGDAPVSLSNYSLCLVRNDDSDCTKQVVLDGGELEAGDVHTVCRRQAGHPASNDPAAPIKDNCDQQAPGPMTFSGDDRLLVFETTTGEITDAFGITADRPWSSTWANVLYRRCDFTPFDGSAFDLGRFARHTSGDMGDFGTAPTETCAH